MPTNSRNRKFKPKSYRTLKTLSVDEIRDLLPAKGLDEGGHEAPGAGLNEDGQLCLMEAVAYITGEPHSDHPQCACPRLTDLGIGFNDSHGGDEDAVSELIPAIPALVGSKTGSARVRWKRAKATVKLLFPKAIEELQDRYSESTSVYLLEKLEGLSGVRTRDEARAALEILGMFDDRDEAANALHDAIDSLVKVWNSDGISERAYARVMPEELSSIFTDPSEQADVLTTLGHIRS